MRGRTRPRPERDGSTISASGGQGRGVVWVDHLQKGGGARRWRMRWRVPSTTPTLHSQRAKSSPLWSRLFPETLIGRGLARIAQILWGKAPCGAGIACPPARTPRRGATRGGGSGGSDPLFFAAGAAPGRGRWCTPKSTTFPPLSGVAPSTVVPGGKAIERCRGQGRSTDRSCPSTPGGQVAGPVIHEPASTLEQVRALVGCLDLAADLVRQGSLRHFARMIGLFGRPVPEARPEAVRHRRDVQLPEQFRQRRVRERLAPNAGKHEQHCCERVPAPPPGSPGRDGTAGPGARGARDSPSCAGPGWSTRPRRCRFSRHRGLRHGRGRRERRGVMEGPGESSPRSGVRRGRSPSPAPMYYIG